MSDTMTLDTPKRWDVSFGQDFANPAERREMTAADIDRLMSIEPFSNMREDAFPRSAPLRGILQHDTRIRRYRSGDIVVRQGDYGNSAFLILKGDVRVFLESLDPKLTGRREKRRKSLIRDLLQPLLNPRSAEVRDTRAYQQMKQQASEQAAEQSVDWGYVQGVTNVLDAEPDIFENTRTSVMKQGELFGELAALGRIPRAASVVADGEVELLEIRWQGLRDLRKHDEALRQYIDDRYRRFGLAATLRGSELLKNLSDEAAEKVAQAAEFETYGSYDWYGSYQQLRQKQADLLTKEPIIAEEGHYTNGLVIIRAGFARLSRQYGNGEQTFSYLGKGGIYGLNELVHNARHPDQQMPLQATLRAIGYVDVVRIPTRTFEELILPTIPPDMLPDAAITPEAGAAATSGSQPTQNNGQPDRVGGSSEQTIDSGMMEFMVENRFVNGTATMVIDLDRCTRCDDCTTACATGHSNNPVFVRHGPKVDDYMVANACMHCVDPVCMIGCPTGAIHRDEQSGDVVINDLTCIGCTTCAAACPYNNIRMVETRDKWNDDALVVDPVRGKPLLKATKCDLCEDHYGGPACQRACPHDALRRVDMRNLPDFAKWLNR